MNHFFQTWNDDRHDYALHFDIDVHDLGFHSRSQGLQESLKVCNHSIIECHDVTQTFAEIDYVKGMTATKSCKYGEFGSFEQLLFLFWFLTIFYPAFRVVVFHLQ